MTPEQKAKIHALRNGTEYVPPKEYVRLIPKSVEAVKQKINFKKLFEERSK